MDAKFTELVEQLNGLDFKGMYGSDFLHTWDKTTDELKALYIVADALRELRENNVSSKIFDSGLAVSLFRDNSTRTRFSFSKAANLLGLELQDLPAVADQPAAPLWHGRHPGSPRGLRPHARGRRARQGLCRRVRHHL